MSPRFSFMGSTHAGIYIGIDGGGSRSRFLATDAEGSVLGIAFSGPLNIHNSDEALIIANLQAGFQQIKTNLSEGVSGYQVFAGIAGVKSQEDVQYFEGLLRLAIGGEAAVKAVNDTDITLAGGLVGAPGIALILGSGSHCLGRNAEGEIATCGGWSYLMDDCGSAYALGHETLRLAVRTWDGRSGAHSLAERVRQHFGIDKPEQILTAVHQERDTFITVKELSRLVLQAAKEGDEDAMRLVKDAAVEAAELVEQVANKLSMNERADIVLTGGIATNLVMNPILVEVLLQRKADFRVSEVRYPPVAGAVIRAVQEVGESVGQAFLDNMERGLVLYQKEL